MIDIERFDPFNNRLCRNVRNALSEGFKESLDKNDLQPVQRIAGYFLDDAPPAVIKVYIDNRMTAYKDVLSDIGSRRFDDPLDVAFLIWDRGLFFETHEYLEVFWMTATGDQKKLLQAIIRAAGAYVHLEQGNRTGARRIADKALAVLELQQDRLASHIDPHLLMDKLKQLDPVPPVLSKTALPGSKAEG